MTTVNWIATDTSDYSAHRGTDADGNRYWSPANGETVYCTTPDGFKGRGWTPAQALESAIEERIEAMSQKRCPLRIPRTLSIEEGAYWIGRAREIFGLDFNNIEYAQE